jgi:hypothetical protein
MPLAAARPPALLAELSQLRGWVKGKSIVLGEAITRVGTTFSVSAARSLDPLGEP